MNAYLSFLILSVLAVLQSTLLPHLKVLGVQPDLVLLVIVAWSLLRGAEEGMLWALIGGVALDILSSARLGTNTLPLLLISFLTGLWQRGLVRQEVLVPFLAIPVATIVYQSLMVALLKLLGWPGTWSASFRYAILPTTLVNTLLMPVVYVLMRWIHRRTYDENIEW
jgi:rod shape-determining protein MreD